MWQDKTGKRFGRLTVIEKVGSDDYGYKWLCQCDCGNSSVVRTISLVPGGTKSCGCLIVEGIKKRATTHGYFGTRTYGTWASMIDRCTNPKSKPYKNYGGRGIIVCRQWRKFEGFLADMGEQPDGLTLERKNNELGYFPENCKWADYCTQANNRRGNRRCTIRGETMTVAEWCKRLGIKKRGAIYQRLAKGWPAERAFTEQITRAPRHAVNSL